MSRFAVRHRFRRISGRVPASVSAFVLILSVAGVSAYAQSDEVVATVKGETITLADLEARLEAELAKLEQQRHQLLEGAIGPLVDERLLEVEAQERELTARELFALEVTAQTAEVTDAEVDQWYEQNKARVGNNSKEEIAPQIKQFLEQQRVEARRTEYLRELRAKHDVKILLEPMRSEIDLASATWKGNEKAPVTLVEFSDFQCPACKGFNPILGELLAAYPDKVRVAFLQYPLRQIHPQAQKAAEAALCARDEGKFWELHDVMFADQRKLDVPSLKATARELGVNGDAFDACLDGGKYEQTVQADLELGDRVGVSGTPSVYVNGRVVSPGRVPSLDMLTAMVEDELARIDD